MRLLFLSVVVGLAMTTVQAQAPQAANVLPVPSAEAARLLLPDALLGGGGESVPDTTSPWHYYPLNVGDAWEYATFDRRTVYRREINRDTLINGRRYAIVERFIAQDGGPLGSDSDPFDRLRFDTLSALVYEPFTDGSGMERVFGRAPCPFDADFDSTITCPGQTTTLFDVTGSYEGLLVFGGSEPGTGEDTVRTAVKQFSNSDVGVKSIRTYAAGFGEILRIAESLPPYGLYYARIDGVEYGVPRFPVAAEPGLEAPAPEPLATWPNPARSRLNIGFPPSATGSSERLLTVYDLLGRRQYEEVVTSHAAVQALDVTGWAAGTYVAILSAPGTSHRSTFTVLSL